MTRKKLVLVIEAHQGYLRNSSAEGSFSARNSILFSAITDTYIPMLNMFCRLEKDGIPFKIALVISPVLCSLLSDPYIHEQYISHLDSLIALGKSETERQKSAGCAEQAASCLAAIEQAKHDFTQTYGCNLLETVQRFVRKGCIELIPTAATYAYLPHYADFPEAVNAQIETGLYSQRQFFGDSGEGFWLPYMGWAKDLDRAIRSYGQNYALVDARALLFSKECPETGIFSPVRTRTSLALFGCDPDTPRDIAGENGFSSGEAYRSQNHDIGFELQTEEAEAFFGKGEARIQTGYKYWSNASDDRTPVPYCAEEARKQIIKDAIQFYESKLKKLDEAAEYMKEENAVLVCAIPAELLGQTWHEGVEWLENVIRCADAKKGFDFELCRNLIENQFSLPKISPYPCSSNGLGYGEDLLDSTNSWMMRYVRKATDRMIDLTGRFPSETSLKERLLNMAAKQVLLAQSGEWPMMIHDGKFPGHAEELFKEEILSFSKVFDSLASNTVSTEWLTLCEKRNALFPWLNYRIFSRKK